MKTRSEVIKRQANWTWFDLDIREGREVALGDLRNHWTRNQNIWVLLPLLLLIVENHLNSQVLACSSVQQATPVNLCSHWAQGNHRKQTENWMASQTTKTESTMIQIGLLGIVIPPAISFLMGVSHVICI